MSDYPTSAAPPRSIVVPVSALQAIRAVDKPWVTPPPSGAKMVGVICASISRHEQAQPVTSDHRLHVTLEAG